MALLKKALKWGGIILLVGFIVLVGFRMKYRLDLEKTNEQVAKIHATKLTLDDVMGTNLPPNPGEAADDTIAGVDANTNGIRDDVELAIFEKYPNSPKTRAPLLQYALVLQMEVMQPFLNKETVTEVIKEQSRADACVSDTLVPRKSPESSRNSSEIDKIDTYINFVKNNQFNTEARQKARQDFIEYLGSFSESINAVCDVNIPR